MVTETEGGTEGVQRMTTVVLAVLSAAERGLVVGVTGHRQTGRNIQREGERREGGGW